MDRLTPRKCPTKKRCFTSHGEAQPHIESLRKKEHPSRAATLCIYRCRICLHLHIGHNFRPATERTARRGKHRRPRPAVGQN